MRPSDVTVGGPTCASGDCSLIHALRMVDVAVSDGISWKKGGVWPDDPVTPPPASSRNFANLMLSVFIFGAVPGNTFPVLRTRLRIPLDLRLNAIGMSLDEVIKRCRDNVMSKSVIHQSKGQKRKRAKPVSRFPVRGVSRRGQAPGRTSA